MLPHGTTFNAETAELAEQDRFLCGFREFRVDRRRWGIAGAFRDEHR
jgi:hypothetical protein